MTVESNLIAIHKKLSLLTTNYSLELADEINTLISICEQQILTNRNIVLLNQLIDIKRKFRYLQNDIQEQIEEINTLTMCINTLIKDQADGIDYLNNQINRNDERVKMQNRELDQILVHKKRKNKFMQMVCVVLVAVIAIYLVLRTVFR